MDKPLDGHFSFYRFINDRFTKHLGVEVQLSEGMGLSFALVEADKELRIIYASVVGEGIGESKSKFWKGKFESSKLLKNRDKVCKYLKNKSLAKLKRFTPATEVGELDQSAK